MDHEHLVDGEAFRQYSVEVLGDEEGDAGLEGGLHGQHVVFDAGQSLAVEVGQHPEKLVEQALEVDHDVAYYLGAVEVVVALLPETVEEVAEHHPELVEVLGLDGVADCLLESDQSDLVLGLKDVDGLDAAVVEQVEGDDLLEGHEDDSFVPGDQTKVAERQREALHEEVQTPDEVVFLERDLDLASANNPRLRCGTSGAPPSTSR